MTPAHSQGVTVHLMGRKSKVSTEASFLLFAFPGFSGRTTQEG